MLFFSASLQAQIGEAFPEVQYFGRRIYDFSKWLVRIPVKLATPYVINYKVERLLEDMDLEPDVRAGIEARIRREDFVDDIVPFLIDMKNLYAVPEEESKENFDTFFRSQFKGRNIPGIEHSMFHWKVDPPAASGSGMKLDREMKSQLVTLFYIIFIWPLEGEVKPRSLLDHEPVRDMRIILRADAVVQKLLNHLRDQLDPKSEYREMLDHMANNDDRRLAVTVTLVDFVTHTAYNSYQMLRKRVNRGEDLRVWMLSELEKIVSAKTNRERSRSDLWKYLSFSMSARRYGVQVVVDGLQGSLLEALSLGYSSSPFIQSIYKEQRESESYRPKTPTVKLEKAPSQNTGFLEYFAKEGFQDPFYLTHFRYLYNFLSYGLVETGVATTPTISVRNLPIAKMGAPVTGTGSTGIPNFHFVNREIDRAYYFWGNDAFLLPEIAKSSGMKTMYERMHDLNTLNCNAQYDSGAVLSFDGLFNLIIGERKRDFGELLCVKDLTGRAEMEAKLNSDFRQKLLNLKDRLNPRSLRFAFYYQNAKDLINDWAPKDDLGMPQYLLNYNPWPDHFAHGKGPFSDEIISPSGELNRLDYWFGRIQKIYLNAGLRTRTLFSMVGDHGLTPVFYMVNPENEIFEKISKDSDMYWLRSGPNLTGDPEIQVRILKISSDEGGDPRLINHLHPPSVRNYDLIVASTAGGNYMMDFFKGHDADSWKVQPVIEDLKHLKTLAGAEVNVLDTIIRNLGDTLDYLVVREAKCTPKFSDIWVMGPREIDGQLKLLTTHIIRHEKKIFYRADQDLLGIHDRSRYRNFESSFREDLVAKCESADEKNDATWCSEQEWLELTRFTNRPDSVVQLAHLYDTDLAGTINLFPRMGFGYNTNVPGRHAGEGFHEKDAFVGFWGGPVQIRASSRIRSARIGAVAPTVYEYLTNTLSGGEESGWAEPSLSSALFGSSFRPRRGD